MREKRHGTWGEALRVAGALVGGLIGAGFASGQEVLQFFTAYGPLRGALGAVLVLLVLAPLCAALLGGARLGKTAQKLLPLVCFAVYAVMLGGAGALVQAACGLPPVWGRTAMLAATLASVLLGLDRLTALLALAGPGIVVFVVAAGAAALAVRPQGLVNAGAVWPLLPRPARCWWVAALVYAGCNALLMAPFLQAMGGHLAGKRSPRRAAWVGCGAFAAALLLLHLGLSAHLGRVAQSPAPAVALAAGLWPGAPALAAPVLLAGVYTTAVPLLWGAGAGLAPVGRPCPPGVLCAVAWAGWAWAVLPFARLVGLLYPALGWLGLVLALRLLCCARRKDVL